MVEAQQPPGRVSVTEPGRAPRPPPAPRTASGCRRPPPAAAHPADQRGEPSDQETDNRDNRPGGRARRAPGHMLGFGGAAAIRISSRRERIISLP